MGVFLDLLGATGVVGLGLFFDVVWAVGFCRGGDLQLESPWLCSRIQSTRGKEDIG